jgi:hypothetical protein
LNDKDLDKEALAVFKQAAAKLTFDIGSRSKAIKAIQKKTALPLEQLHGVYIQEGSKQMDGFIKTIMVNYVNVLGTANVALIDVALLGILFFGHAVASGLKQGWQMEDEFVEQQTRLFRVGLEDVIANYHAHKADDAPPVDAPRIEVVKA